MSVRHALEPEDNTQHFPHDDFPHDDFPHEETPHEFHTTRLLALALLLGTFATAASADENTNSKKTTDPQTGN